MALALMPLVRMKRAVYLYSLIDMEWICRCGYCTGSAKGDSVLIQIPNVQEHSANSKLAMLNINASVTIPA